MRESASRALAIAALLAQGACASTGALEEEVSKLRRELAAMKTQLDHTELSVQRLEGQVTLLSVSREPVDRAPTTAVAGAGTGEGARATAKNKSKRDVAARERVLPVVRLGGKAEAPVDDGSWVDPGALDDGSPPLMIEMKGASNSVEDAPKLAVDHTVLSKPDPLLARSSSPKLALGAAQEAPASPAEIEADYGAALAKLRTEDKPNEALALFEAFRLNHPQSGLVDNAQYWIGECHFAAKAYDRAIAAFDVLARDHARSPKVPDGWLRSAEAWRALGDATRANKLLEKIIETYPKSDAAKSARSQLDASSSNGGR